jgi:hypothetical protein
MRACAIGTTFSADAGGKICEYPPLDFSWRRNLSPLVWRGWSVCVFDRNPARLWILPVVSLTLGLSPLDYNGIGPELSSRHLHLVVIVPVTGEPAPKRRHKTDFLVGPRRPFEKDDHILSLHCRIVLISHRHLRTPGCATRQRPKLRSEVPASSSLRSELSEPALLT